jgi:hypothetical protein
MIHNVTTNRNNGEATDINCPSVRLSGVVRIFLIWILLKKVAKGVFFFTTQMSYAREAGLSISEISLKNNGLDMEAKRM